MLFYWQVLTVDIHIFAIVMQMNILITTILVTAAAQ